jgi:hypothetical protein
MIRPQAGDIVAVRGTGWFARAILRATGGPASHVGLVLAQAPCVLVLEALTRVRTRLLAQTLAGTEAAWLLHDRTLTLAERRTVVAAALRFSGQGYGWWAIAMQAMNALTASTWWTDHLGGLAGKPICSFLVADAYERVGRTFGQEDRTTTPADIVRWALRHPQKYTVHALPCGGRRGAGRRPVPGR